MHVHKALIANELHGTREGGIHTFSYPSLISTLCADQLLLPSIPGFMMQCAFSEACCTTIVRGSCVLVNG